ncbi:MAG: hypothetical protein KDN18_14335 [Verrucomicrobiae bacterium]|nr:hypothetical protein [Verrucomicrobiae bacterium]
MSRTQYIFIDSENVHEKDLSRVANKTAIVNLILGARQQSTWNKIEQQVEKLGEKAGLTRTPSTGKNALDFVLALEVGMQAAIDPDGYFHIISKDKGFDVLVKHLKEKGILAARRECLAEIPALLTTEERFEKLLSDLKNPKASRPQSRKSLASTIHQAFDRALNEEVIEKTIRYLIHDRILKILETGKVIYFT